MASLLNRGFAELQITWLFSHAYLAYLLLDDETISSADAVEKAAVQLSLPS